MVSEKDGVWIKDGNQMVFFYQMTNKSFDVKFSKSNYLPPVYGPDGEILTEDFAADYFHHRGIFSTWPLQQVLIWIFFVEWERRENWQVL